MDHIFEVEDKTKRIIRLTKKQWTHILTEHPEMMTNLDDIQETLQNPLKITAYSFDDSIRYYFRYLKQRQHSAKHLLVIVKYLNGTGFVITAYFVRRIP